MNTKIIILIVVLVIILGALLWLVPVPPKTVQTPAAAPVEDTTAAINKDLDSIQLDDTSKDFMDVDKNLQSL